MDIAVEQQALSVSALNTQARMLLEDHFGYVWVEGEISNFSAPASGHWYFSLKDADAQVRCAMFRGNNRRIKFSPEHGMSVLVKARVSLYQGRGDFQLIVETIQETGFGALQRAFEQLKKKLDKDGLFNPENKKLIPAIPRKIGVITSSTGAALRDILKVLNRRFSLAPVIIYPSTVQGDLAADELVAAIEIANQRNECDVLLLSRGGGSLEDLWPFNEERVARAVFASDIPVISGIGHEVDFTICDFVADHRAATPSAAAETASPDQSQWLQVLLEKQAYLEKLLHNILQHYRHHISHLSKRLQHPTQRLQQDMQRLDYCFQNLIRVTLGNLNSTKMQLQHLAQSLDTVSPLSTLKRGYAIISKGNDVVTKATQLQSGDKLEVKLSDDLINCTVD